MSRRDETKTSTTWPARTFFNRAIAGHGEPEEVVTDRAAALANVIEELLPQALHNTIKYANNRVECDHGRRGPNGEPSTNDFQVLALLRIVERFAVELDDLPELIPGRSHLADDIPTGAVVVITDERVSVSLPPPTTAGGR